MIGIKVVRILSAVVLLVQCATCGFTREEQRVYDVLKLYLKSNQGRAAAQRSDSLTTVRDHIEVFPNFDFGNVLRGGLTQKDVAMFDIEPSYCPTITMLACGEADVSDEFCLQLLDRVREYVKNAKPRESVEADLKPKPAHAGASPRSSRKFPHSSMKKLYEGLPATNLKNLLSTNPESLEKEYEDFSVKAKAEFDELERRREELIGLSKEEWVEKKSEARLQQLTESVAMLEILSHLPDGNDYLREEWLLDNRFSRDMLLGITNGCYPEQFITCGRRVKSLADAGSKTEASKQCFEAIVKYNDLRRVALLAARRIKTQNTLLGALGEGAVLIGHK